MSKPYTILVADYVPLANKGEEAILRGIEDLLGRGRGVRLGVFGAVVQPTTVGNVTVFPWPWLFRAQGNLGLQGRRRLLHDIMLSLQLRCGYYGRLKNLTHPVHREMQPLRDFFQNCDLVLVGHDGVFCTESCALIHKVKKTGKRVGILGASAVLAPRARIYKGWLYRRALQESDFCIFREEYARQSLGAVAAYPEKLSVGPDPAFAMAPSPEAEVKALLMDFEPYRIALEAGHPIIAATVLEKGRVYNGFRPDLSASDKRTAHARYLATLFKGLIRETNALILFLPHAVETDASDIDAARRMVTNMDDTKKRTLILERDLDARRLKGIIGSCDFLMGERTHSLIGSVSMGTPFVGLTNARDTRTHGIIGQMCQCATQLINIEEHHADTALAEILRNWSQREKLRAQLKQVMLGLEADLQVSAHLVRGV